jgi:hypothetical protein
MVRQNGSMVLHFIAAYVRFAGDRIFLQESYSSAMVGSVASRSSFRGPVMRDSFSSRLCQSIASLQAVANPSVRRDFRIFRPSMNAST